MTQYVDWFVNRDKQRKGFLRLVARDHTTKQIMLVEAPAEMGKTWLLQRWRYECRQANIPVALCDFRDRRSWDYLAIVREARDQFGPASFNALTQAINACTSVQVQLTTAPGSGTANINLATGGGQIGDSQVTIGDVAGRDIIKDNQFFVQTNSETMRQTIEVRITDAFLACLEALQQDKAVVFLFDSYEDVTAEAERWLHAYLLTRIRDGRLPSVVVVIAGRRTIAFDDVWQECVARTGLEDFNADEVADYIVHRRQLTGLDVPTICRVGGQHPGWLSKMADVASLTDAEGKDSDWV